ncbi:Zinc finger and BTB domain-containing protein 24 [Trichinella pseudospiralis]|uniref:Zinc finger and BTB domain-containing protein 24 n=1 Tax=Trichinella pseudospiralis TaxID=6337 RepID=A0A0V1EWW7_TRIPS|nr:Zinc finger and BTB domain-containing protein 24 [Trichinella pseudospiralis]
MHCMSKRVFKDDVKILSLNKQQISINHRIETNKKSPKSNVVPLTKSQMSSTVNLKDKECEYCGKHFAKGNGYQDHLNIHRNIRPYICQICGKSFNNTGAKSNHMRIHDSGRHFHCPLCERSFPWKVSLKVHLKSHQRMGDLTGRIDNILNNKNVPRQIRTRSSKAHNSSVKRREFSEPNKERSEEDMYFNQQQYEERVLPLEALVDDNKIWSNDIANLNYTSSSTITLDSSNTENEMTINGTWAYSTENENNNDDYKNAFLTNDTTLGLGHSRVLDTDNHLGSVVGAAIKCYYDIPSTNEYYEPKLNNQYLGMKNDFSGEKSDPVVIKKETHLTYFDENGDRSSVADRCSYKDMLKYEMAKVKANFCLSSVISERSH